MANRWIVSAAYGRCMGAIEDCRAAYWRAHQRMVDAQARGDAAAAGREQIEMAACLKDRADWIEVARSCPRFVERAA